MRFRYNMKRDGKFFLVTFPDIAEAITQGDTEGHAAEMADEVLNLSIQVYFEQNRVVPKPSPIRKGDRFVELSAGLTAKIFLLNEMIGQSVRPAQLARKMGMTRQDIQRLTNLKHVSKIDGIADALHALGKRLEITVA